MVCRTALCTLDAFYWPEPPARIESILCPPKNKAPTEGSLVRLSRISYYYKCVTWYVVRFRGHIRKLSLFIYAIKITIKPSVETSRNQLEIRRLSSVRNLNWLRSSSFPSMTVCARLNMVCHSTLWANCTLQPCHKIPRSTNSRELYEI